MFEVVNEPMKGLLVIKPNLFKDDRGFFMESFHKKKFKDLGIKENFVQDNHSRSSKNILRGLHFQVRKPQGKLVRVTRGKVFDAVVDLRSGSDTFGEWYGLELSDENHLQLYLPPGFAHGFCVLSRTADFQYKCSEFYDSNDEGGIIWNDKDLKIDWPVKNPIISNKDLHLSKFSEIYKE